MKTAIGKIAAILAACLAQLVFNGCGPDIKQVYDDYNQGRRFEQQGKIEAAIEKYSASIDGHPGFVGGYISRGVCLCKKEQFASALADFKKAIEISPRCDLAHFNSGCVQVELGELERAIETFSCAIDLNPTHAMAWFRRGDAFAKLKQYDLAMNDYSETLRLTPGNADVYVSRAAVCAKQGFSGQTIAELKGAVNVDSQHLAALLLLGSKLVESKRFREAEEYFARVISLEPENAAALQKLGICEIVRNDLGEAATHLRQAVAANPANTQAKYYCGLVLSDLERFVEAEEYLLDATRSCPADAAYRLALAKLYSRTYRAREAIRMIDDILLEAPGHAHALRLRRASEKALRQEKMMGRSLRNVNRGSTDSPNGLRAN
ncbi:MAG: tetratricopeptide (TPR) repeat protein [Pirellulaceae bacterium]|jgi:tetratricopeptide (TPR) repeat protein